MYIPWYDRMEQEKAEREGKNYTTQKIQIEKPEERKKINYEEVNPIKKLSNFERRRNMYLQKWDIAEKPTLKTVVQRTETKSETKPELTGVDRYILAKK